MHTCQKLDGNSCLRVLDTSEIKTWKLTKNMICFSALSRFYHLFRWLYSIPSESWLSLSSKQVGAENKKIIKTELKLKLNINWLWPLLTFLKSISPSNHGSNSDESAAVESNRNEQEPAREKYEISSRRESSWWRIFASRDFPKNSPFIYERSFFVYGNLSLQMELYVFL